jgi:hypothetical protein
MRKVASLAEEVKRRRLAAVPLSRWPEQRWLTFERAYGARKLAAPLREKFREAIGHVVVLYGKALALPKEPSAEEFRDARMKLAELVEGMAAVGFEGRLLRTKENALERLLVGMCIGEITLVGDGGEVIRPLLGPETLRDLATMLKSRAWRYRPGQRGDFALMEFVARLDALAAACGTWLTLSVRRNEFASDARVTSGGGSLLGVVQLLQPALPRVAGSIAEDGESTLRARLRRARDARRRPEVAPIP